VYMEHLYISAPERSLFAFHSLVSQWFQTVMSWEAPENDETTDFRCRRRNVSEGLSVELVAAFCIRRHLSHEGLYDVVLRSVTRGEDKSAIVSTFRATPISFANALAVTGAWLRGFSWES
ncbi:MAG: hypothetical protein ACLFWG_04225, partial [Longimicrobiales bacterium]